MNPEEKVEEALTRVRNWWEANNKYGAKRSLWTIYHSNTRSAKGKKLLENTEFTDADASLEALLENLAIFFTGADKYITIYGRTYKQDSAPITLDFPNPLYESNLAHTNMSGIAGTGSSGTNIYQQGYSKQDIDRIVAEQLKGYKEKFELELEKEKQAMAFERAMEDMQAQIEALASSQKTMLDKALELFSNPTISGLVTGVLSGFLGNGGAGVVNPALGNVNPVNPQNNGPIPQNNGPIPQNTGNSGNPPEMGVFSPPKKEESFANGEPYSDEDIREGEIIEESLDVLDNVFDGEGIEVLDEIKTLALSNPAIMKQLRETMRGMIGKK